MIVLILIIYLLRDYKRRSEHHPSEIIKQPDFPLFIPVSKVVQPSSNEGPEDDRASNIDAVLGLNTGGNTDVEDALYDTAVAIVVKDRKCSTSYIQRKLSIGYNKAAKLVEQMEDEGVVSSANHVGKREILVPEQ